MLTKSSSKSSSLLTLPTFEMLKSKQSKAEVKKKKFKVPYKKGRCLGKGKTAIVFAGKHRKTKERVALKYFIFNDFNDKHPGYVERELGIQKKFDHPNILKVYDIIDYKGNPLLVMERAEGNLLDFMQNRAYMYFDNMVRSIIRQVLSALVHIHQLGFVHRDIKPGNILVGAKGVIKVADFGFTRSIRYTLAGSKAVSGTPDFMPPECYVGDRVYNEKFDIWSTGVTLCYLLLRRRPVDLKPKNKEGREEIMRRLIKIGKVDTLHYEKELGENRRFVSALLTVDYTKRPSASECLKMPWFSDFDEKQNNDYSKRLAALSTIM